MQVGRLGETQQFFKCKNSAILCKVNAKVCRKVQEKSLFRPVWIGKLPTF